MHDPRIGRFFAIDPLSKDYPWYTPYSFSGNKVIAWGELEGLEEYYRANGSYIGKVLGAFTTEIRVVNSPEVETVVKYALYKQSQGLTKSHAKEYKWDKQFARGNSMLLNPPVYEDKPLPSDRLVSNNKEVLSSNVRSKTLADKVRDWEMKNGTEAYGSTHGSDIVNEGDGGKFSEYDPMDGWWTGTGEGYVPEKPKPGVTVLTENKTYYNKNGYDSIKATETNTFTTDKKGNTKTTSSSTSVFYNDGDSTTQKNW